MARTFSGTGSTYLTKGSSIVSAEPFSAAAWVTRASLTASANGFDCAMSICLGTALFPGWTLSFVGGTTKHVQAETNQDNNTVDFAARDTLTWATGTWVHIAGVWASTASRVVYANGGSSASNASTATVTGTTQTRIGTSAGTDTASAWNGNIGHMAVWKVALTTADVLALSKGMNPVKMRPASLVSYVPLRGSNSPEIDLKGGSWTMTGSPAQVSNPRVYGA